MAQVKDLLLREDLVGGEIQIHKDNKVTRAKITRVGRSHTNVVFILGDTVKQTDDPEQRWKKAGSLKRVSFKETLTSTEGCRCQFDIKGGWVIIFPKGDWSVI